MTGRNKHRWEGNFEVYLKELVWSKVALNKPVPIIEKWCLLLNGFWGSIKVREISGLPKQIKAYQEGLFFRGVFHKTHSWFNPLFAL